MGDTALTEDKVFEDDQGYLEAYVEICHCLNERHEILEDISRHRCVPYPEKEDRKRAIARLEELNQAIQDGEWFFWEKVARSKEIGVRFIFEEVVCHNGLDHLGKRIALFFLCSHMSRAYDFALSKFWVVEIFDTERSIIKKMGSLGAFDEEKPLMKSGILSTIKEWDECDYVYKYRINPKFLNFFCQRLDGSDMQWSDAKKDTPDKSKANEIGLIKDPDYSLDDVILKDSDKERISFFLTTHKNGSLAKLGIDKVVKKGKGLTFLFYGPPGTGKSMLGEAVASFMGKKILVAETSKIICCLLGETDKNISKMFDFAKANDAAGSCYNNRWDFNYRMPGSFCG